MADGRWISTPVLGAVVHPGHMLWVPMPLWLLIAGTATVVGVAVGIVDGTGVRSELTAVVGIGMYAFCARAYRRDRHVVGVWRARFGPAPMAPKWPLKAIVSRRRSIGGES